MNHSGPHMKKAALVLALLMVLSVSMPVLAESSTWGLLSNGDFTLAADTEIYWAETESSLVTNEALLAQVELFAAELADKVTGTALPICYGPAAKAGETDIILVLDAQNGIAQQGYEIVTRAGGTCTVYASDADGLFYGCRDVIKQLTQTETVSAASEAPTVLERSLLLDNGRKFYSKDWIIECIRELSWANMNSLSLHFTEEMGIRIESKLYPWLAGSNIEHCTQTTVYDEDYFNTFAASYLTQDDLREIAAAAKLYHVDLVPSFDSPGHMNYIVRMFNEKARESGGITFTYNGTTYNMDYNTNNGNYRGYTVAENGTKTKIVVSPYGIGNYFSYNGSTAIVQGSGNDTAKSYSRGIDISNEVAVAFTMSLVKEYAELFYELGSRTFDIGGDELLGWGTAAVSTSTASRWKQLDHWKAYAQERAKAEGYTNYSSCVGYDAFMFYMNDMNDLVRSVGFTNTRMWNDDALRDQDTGWSGVVTLDKNIDIEYWSWRDSATPTRYAEEGYSMYNYINTYNYYVLHANALAGASYPYVNEQAIYTEWNPYVFSQGGSEVAASVQEKIKGSSFCIWSDEPSIRTEAEVMEDVRPLMRAAGAKAWDKDADSALSYTDYKTMWTALGDAPKNTAQVGEIYLVPDTSALEAAVAEYASFDASIYTEASAAAYADAVKAGEAVLAMDKPTWDDVDQALQAIIDTKKVLEIFVADTAALEAAIAAFNATDASLYEPASYAAYQEAAANANTVLNTVGASQQAVDDAAAALNAAAQQLVQKAPVSDVSCLKKATFRSTRCNVNRVATLSVIYSTAVDVDHFVVVDDLGNNMEFTKVTHLALNSKTPDQRTTYLLFSPTLEQRGNRTFTVYAVYTDGTRSADELSAALTVR